MLKRNYVVLALHPTGAWVQFTAIYARSRRSAVHQATESGSYGNGTYRAITARAWGKPIEVER